MAEPLELSVHCSRYCILQMRERFINFKKRVHNRLPFSLQDVFIKLEATPFWGILTDNRESEITTFMEAFFLVSTSLSNIVISSKVLSVIGFSQTLLTLSSIVRDLRTSSAGLFRRLALFSSDFEQLWFLRTVWWLRHSLESYFCKIIVIFFGSFLKEHSVVLFEE